MLQKEILLDGHWSSLAQLAEACELSREEVAEAAAPTKPVAPADSEDTVASANLESSQQAPEVPASGSDLLKVLPATRTVLLTSTVTVVNVDDILQTVRFTSDVANPGCLPKPLLSSAFITAC